MGKEDVVNRILSDAEAESAEIVAKAEERAAIIIGGAEEHCAKERAEAEAEAAERAKAITSGKAAAARLDSNKIMLEGKRRVISAIYKRAEEKLAALGKKESLALYSELLSENADEGDEIELARSFAYGRELLSLPVISAKKLTVSGTRADIDGGFILRGEKCDKDLSFSALLKADMEERQAELAARLFKTE